MRKVVIWQVGAEAVVRHLAQRALDIIAKSGGEGAPSTEALCARGSVASSSGRGGGGGGARYRTRGAAPGSRAAGGGAPDQATEAEALCAREPGGVELQKAVLPSSCLSHGCGTAWDPFKPLLWWECNLGDALIEAVSTCNQGGAAPALSPRRVLRRTWRASQPSWTSMCTQQSLCWRCSPLPSAQFPV